MSAREEHDCEEELFFLSLILLDEDETDELEDEEEMDEVDEADEDWLEEETEAVWALEAWISA